MILKTVFAASLLCATICNGVNAQTLFNYGNKKTDAKEFLRAYEKNNPAKPANKATAINEYLNQYIRSRLKTAEAYERKYDTLQNIRMEIASLRSQIADKYMADPQLKTRLEKEAIERSKKDIRFAHIFISFTNPSFAIDTVAATKKKDEVLQRLKKGEDFMLVAQQLSDDPAAKQNKGDGGYITTFTLPYEFETAIYNTPVGKYSAVVRSKSGYHIFKNISERKAAGKIKAQQILLAFPQGADDAAKKGIKHLADSLHTLLVKGGNFEALATTYSNDYISASNGGKMPDISVGQYDAEFENQLWALKKDGDISKPFLTAHGWHIVRRLGLTPVNANMNDKNYMQDLTEKIMTDGRWKSARDFIYNAIKAKGLYQKVFNNDVALWAYSDSLLNGKTLGDGGKGLTATTTLFNLGKASYNTNSWITYAQNNRFQTDGSGTKPYNSLWDEWVKSSMYSYYRDNLENFNEDFAAQMREFTDGNLFFEIMQQEIWNKAQADTAVLRSMYAANMKKYMWQKSAEAVIFFCADSTTLKDLYNQVKASPAEWKSISESFGDRVLADSSRYDWAQLPGLGTATAKDNMITKPVVNPNDFTGSFSYIIKSSDQAIQKKYNEALGLVINDYQAILEKRFDDELAKKFPVVINKAVLAKISK